MNWRIRIVMFFIWGVLICGSSVADSHCASTEQARAVIEFYAENPGVSPVVAARQLGLPDAAIGSALPEDQAAGTDKHGFGEIWTALTKWQTAIVIVTKGADVIEVFSPISAGEWSEDGSRFNLSHDHPLAGHLRPGTYSSIYAYRIPGKDGAVTRGVIFYDQSGATVFAVMMSGKGPPAPPEEAAKFDALMSLVRSLPAVCQK